MSTRRQKNKKRLIVAQPYCTYCRSRLDLTLDHIIPHGLCHALGLSSEVKENYQVLCRNCNLKKGNNLKSNCPTTVRLLKKFVQQWEFLSSADISRRKYVWRNLPVKSLQSKPTIYVSDPDWHPLKYIYLKQSRVRKLL